MELTLKMLDAACAAGCEVIIDSVEGVVTETGGSSSSTRITGLTLSNHGNVTVSRVVFAMGPWTGALLEQWIPDIKFPMEGIYSTSIVYKNVESLKVPENSFACFCDEDSSGCHLELYPRSNGDMYVCGCGGSDHVSGDRLRKGGDCEHAGLIIADPARVAAAHRSFSSITSLAADRGEPDIAQVYFKWINSMIPACHDIVIRSSAHPSRPGFLL